MRPDPRNDDERERLGLETEIEVLDRQLEDLRETEAILENAIVRDAREES